MATTKTITEKDLDALRIEILAQIQTAREQAVEEARQHYETSVRAEVARTIDHTRRMLSEQMEQARQDILTK